MICFECKTQYKELPHVCMQNWGNIAIQKRVASNKYQPVYLMGKKHIYYSDDYRLRLRFDESQYRRKIPNASDYAQASAYTVYWDFGSKAKQIDINSIPIIDDWSPTIAPEGDFRITFERDGSFFKWGNPGRSRTNGIVSGRCVNSYFLNHWTATRYADEDSSQIMNSAEEYLKQNYSNMLYMSDENYFFTKRGDTYYGDNRLIYQFFSIIPALWHDVEMEDERQKILEYVNSHA